MLNKRFENYHIRLWLLYVAATPFMLHYTKLLKAYSTTPVAQETYQALARLTI